MGLTIFLGIFTVVGVLLALPKSRRWLLSKIKIFGQDEHLSIGAELFVYRLKHGIYHLAEIYNAGPENILDLKVTIYWENNQGKNKREVHRFIDDGVDPLWAKPRDRNILEKEKKILIVDFPFKELKGLVKVNIQGKTHLSKGETDRTFEI